MKNQEVVRAFLRKESAKAANLRSDGSYLFSYAELIARWEGSEIRLTDKDWSITTKRHKSILQKEANRFALNVTKGAL